MSDGEFERIARIRRLLYRGRADVLLGIGDDAAVLAPSAAPLVWTVDVAIEGVHFRSTFASWQTLGRRALMAAASDLAAMGAEPRAALLSLVLPRGFAECDLDALVSGVAAGADEVGLEVVGGNLSGGDRVGITTSVVGAAHGPLLTRSGARPGDLVYVTGRPGERALGLALLLADDTDADGVPFVEAWRHPSARIEAGRYLVGRASAVVDVSDGLAQDLGHVAEASRVAVVMDANALPLSPELVAAAEKRGLDAIDLSCTGGEEYELAFTAPTGADVPVGATCIGHVEAGDGVFLVRDGSRARLGARGFDHFA